MSGGLRLSPALSATGLRAWARCERLFAYTYVYPRPWPGPQQADPHDSERRSELGTQLHQLIHQHALGLDPRLLARTDQELWRWFERYRASAHASPAGVVYSELNLNARVGGEVVRATLDRVIQNGSEFVIVDWKTGQHVPDEAELAEDWQARLYPFVLAEAGAVLNGGEAIAPAAITMVFYYVAHGQEVRITHSRARHEATRAALLAVVETMAQSGFEPTGKQGVGCLKPSPCRFYTLCHMNAPVLDGDVTGAGDEEDEPAAVEGYLELLPEHEFDDEPVSL